MPPYREQETIGMVVVREAMKIKRALLIAILLFGTIPTLVIAASSHEALLMAVYKKDYALIDQLLRQGADINAFDSENLPETPLAVASGYGDIKLVNYLVSRGANVEGPEEFPNQAMYLAIGGNYSQVVNRFLDLGVSPNYAWPNRNGGTLLITAVQFGKKEVVELLLGRGAEANFTGNGDYSPLYRSIIYDRFAVCKVLLEHGAQLNERDKQALSEMKWGNSKTDKKYMLLLKERGKVVKHLNQ